MYLKRSYFLICSLFCHIVDLCHIGFWEFILSYRNWPSLYELETVFPSFSLGFWFLLAVVFALQKHLILCSQIYLLVLWITHVICRHFPLLSYFKNFPLSLVSLLNCSSIWGLFGLRWKVWLHLFFSFISNDLRKHCNECWILKKCHSPCHIWK